MDAKRVILDTDIGTDVDDCLALALLLASPEVHLEGVTCVYGDVGLRARIVQKLLQLHGSPQVPILLGAEVSLLNHQPPYWEGHEGKGLLAPDDPALQIEDRHAVQFIIDTVMANPGEIHLLAIGPLTNIALALRLEPRLAPTLSHIYIMGGVFRGLGTFHLSYTEHNIKSDPDAAHIVFASGVPTTLVPLNVTVQTRIQTEDVERIRAANSPYRRTVAAQVARYPRFAKQGWTYLHDPLAAAVLIDPSFVRREPLHVEVETEGRLTRGITLAKSAGKEDSVAQVALEVDARRFEQWLIHRITTDPLGARP